MTGTLLRLCIGLSIITGIALVARFRHTSTNNTEQSGLWWTVLVTFIASTLCGFMWQYQHTKATVLHRVQNTTITPLEEQLVTLEADIATLSRALENANALKEEHAALLVYVEELESTPAPPSPQAQNAEAKLQTLRNERDALQSTVDELNLQIQRVNASPEITQSSMEPDANDTQAELYETRLERDNLQQRLRELEHTNSIILVERETITENLAVYETRFSELQTSNEALGAEKAALQETNAALITQMDGREAQWTELEAENLVLMQQIITLAEALQKARARN